ncbi:uracil-DNA glycosylase [Bifidobacterium animalis subsp. animalis MCC 1489]|uniref:Uracil-DNA glycosylase, putative n=1 Tax=Bifidobacterium animalis subsp. animalis IM386 TaxID=1402194 RepID=A0AAV2W230_9BIFI|nr:uracil-DNA glycosylase family protein [Bifidobacterium animalis]AFI62987.1 Uracil-DNA glycosylase, putative [Bifidobacterium animalis subsp. animalis ATCC 25527]AYN23624.1 Uracil-DNA glycosylase [Bifidobacterium animalis subsp. animalis]KFI43459.1 uracil DNA glycosylase family protein [Bifidobacterium animalis subsp. animalis]KOA65066.1 uracil-DNA glycosylase [Bifidobacterium animalis subsp. animalis MCC 1489]CDI67741.1 Uracil-DNA glycosylase, putative [Bifidobacterium animalis subsp. anima
METIESITKQIMDDPCDAEFTKRGEKPVFSAPSTALITIVGQSPSLDAQTRGLCWDDRSGDTLRKWLDVDKETFYDSGKFALVPMDFYYLGDVPGDKGMEEPREWVAPTYHPAIMKLLPDVKLTILAGSYAVKYYLNQWSKARLEDTVKNFQEYLPKYFPIVHPSGRTDIWRTEHPWFDGTVVPALREHVHAILGK